MVRPYRVGCACVAVLLVVGLGRALAATGGSAAEDLTKRLPDNVVGFAATSGGDAIKGDFDKSILGRIWNDPGVRSIYQSVETSLVAKVQQEAGDPNEVKQIDMALGLAQLVASRPIVLGVAQVKGPVQGDKPPVYAFAVLDAGGRKAEFEAAVKKLETLAGADQIADVNVGAVKMRGPRKPQDVSLYWGWSGNYLVVAANDAEGAAMQYLQKPRAAAPEYLKKVPSGGDAIVFRADIQKTVSIIDSVARQTGKAATGDTMMAVLRELGLSNVKAITSRAGFAGSDIVTGSFLEAPGPRTGLLAALKPVDPALMEIVDARAVAAGAVNLDVASVYDTVMRAIKAASGEGYADVEKGLAAFEAEAKLSVRKGLLESLAGPVIFYTLGAGTMPEAPMGGAVVLVKLKDAKAFETTMTSLGSYAAAQSKGAFQASSQKRDDGRMVHTWVVPQLAMMQVMPTWSIAGDFAVIGSNTTAHDFAVRQVASSGQERKSITGTPRYKEAVPRLPGDLVSLGYADSQTQYTQAMVVFQQLWPMAAMFAGQASIKLPPTLPSLSAIIKDMKPASRSCWMDADGLYTQYRGPGIEESLKSVAGASIGAGVLLPALARARDQARRAASMSNLKQIGLGSLMYANEHDNKLPDDLKAIQPYQTNPKVLDSPRKPKDFAGPSYIYLPGQSTSSDAHNIVVYENPAFCQDGVDVLFLDGHVEFMKPDAFRRELAATCKRLEREVPEVKFKGEVK